MDKKKKQLTVALVISGGLIVVMSLFLGRYGFAKTEVGLIGDGLFRASTEDTEFAYFEVLDDQTYYIYKKELKEFSLSVSLPSINKSTLSFEGEGSSILFSRSVIFCAYCLAIRLRSTSLICALFTFI